MSLLKLPSHQFYLQKKRVQMYVGENCICSRLRNAMNWANRLWRLDTFFRLCGKLFVCKSHRCFPSQRAVQSEKIRKCVRKNQHKLSTTQVNFRSRRMPPNGPSKFSVFPRRNGRGVFITYIVSTWHFRSH